MDLDDLPTYVTGRGRASPLEVMVERGLEPADLALIDEVEVRPRGITTLRDRHHALARVIASGAKNIEAAALTGYGPDRVNLLVNDPTFKELVEFYRSNDNLALADLHSRMGMLALEATNILQDRLETAPDDISTASITEIIKTTADRTGYGVKQTQINLNVDLESALERARRRSGVQLKEVNHDQGTKTITLDPRESTRVEHSSASLP